MCDPISIGVATAGVSAASAVYGFVGQAQQAKGARRTAGINYGQDYNEAAARGIQIDARQSELSVDALIKKVAAQGRISASAASLGLADPTVAAQGNAAGFEAGRDLEIENLNTINERAALARGLVGADLERQSRINANKGPSAFELGLGLSRAALKGVNAYSGAGGKLG